MENQGLSVTTMAAKAVARVVLRCEKAQEEKHLDLSQCLLEAVPQAVYHLMRNTELITCDLSHNALTLMSKKLPVKFPHLGALDLSHNKIERLPDEINQMTALETFDASNNDLTTIPDSLYELPQLKILNLSHNDIKDIDATKLCNMSAIKEINLECNPLPGNTYSACLQLAQESNIKLLISEPDMAGYLDVD